MKRLSPTHIISNILAVLLIGCMPLVITPGWRNVYYEGKSLFTLALAALMLLWLFAVHISRKSLRQLLPHTITDWSVLVFSVFCALSTVFSIDLNVSVKGWPALRDGLTAYLVGAAIYWFFTRMVDWKEEMWVAVMVCAAIVSIIGATQFFDAVVMGSGYAPTNMSTIGNRNFIGTYVTLLMPIALWLYVKYGNLMWLMFSGLLFLLMFASLTRSAWVALPVWILVLIGCLLVRESTIDASLKANRESMEKRRSLFQGLGWEILRLLLFICFMTAAFFMVDRLSEHALSKRFLEMFQELSNLSADDVGSFRMHIWKTAWPLVDDRPWIGYGPDTFSQLLLVQPGLMQHMKEKLEYVKAHNEFLQMAITLGFPGLIAYLSAVGSAMYCGLRAMRSEPWRAALLCAVIGYVVQGQFNIAMTATTPIFWAFLGLLSKPRTTNSPANRDNILYSNLL